MTVVGAYEATLALLATRAGEATICPSEVARTLAAPGGAEAATAAWRTMMPAVHEAVDRLVVEGKVRLSWKGKTLAARQGPYRIGRGERR